jgi:type VI secretion system protein
MTWPRLTLRIVSRQADQPGIQASCVPDGAPFTIGRGTACSWILPDPERHVSKCHCVVEHDGRDWIVTDTSTNGLYINRRPEPLGPDRTAVLHEGDVLSLGTYEISVGCTHADHPAGPFGTELPTDFGQDLLSDVPAAGIGPELPDGPAEPPWPDSPPWPRTSPDPDAGIPGDRSGDRDESWEAFLAGAGLEELRTLAPQQRVAAMRIVGNAYRTAVRGLMQALQSRASVKAAFRIDQTTLRALDNNPLKFVPDADEALRSMILPPRPGFKSGDEAMREAMDDIKAHEMAMMAAIQKAVADLLKEFDPEMLSRRLEHSGPLAALLPAARKAQYWEVYERHYQQIASELEEDALGAFGRAFGEAYSAHGRRSRRG